MSSIAICWNRVCKSQPIIILLGSFPPSLGQFGTTKGTRSRGADAVIQSRHVFYAVILTCPEAARKSSPFAFAQGRRVPGSFQPKAHGQKTTAHKNVPWLRGTRRWSRPCKRRSGSWPPLTPPSLTGLWNNLIRRFRRCWSREQGIGGGRAPVGRREISSQNS